MPQPDGHDPALSAIKERDDELRQIIAQAEDVGKLKDALYGIRGRVELAKSRARHAGLLRSAKLEVCPDDNVEIRFSQRPPEDPKVREKIEKVIAQGLSQLRKSSS